MIKLNSPIFGSTERLETTDKDYGTMKSLVDKYPVNAFQMLNKVLNKKDLRIQVDTVHKIEIQR